MSTGFGIQGGAGIGWKAPFRTTLRIFRRAFNAETPRAATFPIRDLRKAYGVYNILRMEDIRVPSAEERFTLWKAHVQPFARNQIRPTLVSMTSALDAQARTARKSSRPVVDVPEQFGASAGEVARAAAAGLIEQGDYDAFLAAYAKYRSVRKQFGVIDSPIDGTSDAESWAVQLGTMPSALTFVECSRGVRRGVVNEFDETALRGGLLPEVGDEGVPNENALKGMQLLRQAIDEGGLDGAQLMVAHSALKSHNPEFTRMMGTLDSEGQAWFASQFVAALKADGSERVFFDLIEHARDVGESVQI